MKKLILTILATASMAVMAEQWDVRLGALRDNDTVVTNAVKAIEATVNATFIDNLGLPIRTDEKAVSNVVDRVLDTRKINAANVTNSQWTTSENVGTQIVETVTKEYVENLGINTGSGIVEQGNTNVVFVMAQETSRVPVVVAGASISGSQFYVRMQNGAFLWIPDLTSIWVGGNEYIKDGTNTHAVVGASTLYSLITNMVRKTVLENIGQ